MDQARPIIIKKKKVAGGDGHHGGAWKVAYADFVTAMMAFFLLMWLLNATSEDQRKGLADYFDPEIPISRNSASGAGMLNGDTPKAKDEAASTETEGVRPKPTHREPGENHGDQDASRDVPEDAEWTSAWEKSAQPDSDPGEDGPLDQADQRSGAEGLDKKAGKGDQPQDGSGADQQVQQMQDVVDGLLQQVQFADQDGLIQHFSMRMTPDGLVIEIGDIQGEPLFGSGAASPEPILNTLIDVIVPVLQQTKNDIAVVGHTDAKPFSAGATYTNWELSADRANMARRLLSDAGLPSERIVRVSGKAATEPIADDPLAPRNRRIALLLLRERGG